MNQDTDNRSVLYQTASLHWQHAETLRWTLLYNYLVASTILLLAWAAVFAAKPKMHGRTSILVILAAMGAFSSCLWWALGARANGFAEVYREIAKQLESALSDARGPFYGRDRYLSQDVCWFEKWPTTSFVVLVVPVAFLGVCPRITDLS